MKLVKPVVVRGSILAPASKSMAQRALAMAALAHGRSRILNAGASADVLAAVQVCRQLGANISGGAGELLVDGGIVAPTLPLNCGESGLAARMFAAVAATLSNRVELTGEGSLRNRPMEMVTSGLRLLGVECSTAAGKLPIAVCGPIMGGEIHIDCSQSSQALTGLLIACPLAEVDTIIYVDNLKSQPYIDLTVDMMRQFGVMVNNEGYSKFIVPSGQRYKPCTSTIEGDWSGASFWLVAGAIAGSIEVINLNPHSHQADRAILQALERAGAQVSVRNGAVLVERSRLKGFSFDATHCPDLFPPLVALAAHCEGSSEIKGVSRLLNKESNRALALAQEFGKMGIAVEIQGDVMHVRGGTVQAASTTSHNDHRIAMACAIVALAGAGEVQIHGAEAVSKSFPEFWEMMEGLG